MFPDAVSAHGIQVLKQHEGLRLDAYLDVAGVWTIGFGHTRNVAPDDVITVSQAVEFLRNDLRHAEDCVKRNVAVALNQFQFDALCSFVFNVGCGAFRGSTLLRLLNRGQYEAAAEQFERWNRAGGKVWAGLVARRNDEREMFLKTEV